jgi:hypothetical protein
MPILRTRETEVINKHEFEQNIFYPSPEKLSFETFLVGIKTLLLPGAAGPYTFLFSDGTGTEPNLDTVKCYGDNGLIQ